MQCLTHQGICGLAKQDVQFIHRRGDVKVAKGVKKSVINNDLKFSNYMECLMEEETMEHSFRCIRSNQHSVHTLDLKKKTLSGFDDKRFLLNMIDSVPYGYKHFSKKMS